MYKQKGLSLIELMISLTLGIVLMTGVTQMFLTSRVTYSTQQALSHIQESGRMAIEMLAQDIRMAGYMGCASSNADILYGLDASTDYKYQFTETIRGYDVGDSSPLAGIDPEEDTQVLVLRRASGESVSIVDEHVAGENANFKVSGTVVGGCLLGGQLCGDTIGVITDCTQGRIFRAVTISNNGGNQTIAHSQGGSNPGNLDNTLGGQGFGEGSRIMALNTISYFVKDSSFAPAGADSSVRSLWRKVGEEDPVELIEGVEDMVVEYGIDDGSGDGVPNVYRAPSDMGSADWEEVKAVRLHLLIQGTSENVVPDDQTINIAGEDRTFTDGRMRQVFTTTIGIRGRM